MKESGFQVTITPYVSETWTLRKIYPRYLEKINCINKLIEHEILI